MRADSFGFAVMKCEPMIADIKTLEAKLNNDNNLQAFVAAVRARFVAQC